VRAVIARSVGAVPPLDVPEDAGHGMRHNGVFVTITAKGGLRGCIGYLDSSMPFREAVEKAAHGAAVGDRRFDPVTQDELPEIKIEVSLLGPRERIYHAEQITIGSHGLLLEAGYARGLLLPQVATEYGWDAHEFLRAVCRKAGVPAHMWKDPDSRLFRFTAVRYKAPYQP
jgi:AmmeMemoRadiSam system protein A